MVSAQVSARTSPTSTATRARTYRRIPGGRRPRPFAFHVCAGHSPATQGRNGRLIQPILDTPTGYTRRPPSGVSAGQGPSEHVVAGEGFEPSKLSRWIYSPLPLAARATCLGADGRIATGPRGSSNRGGPHQDKPHHIPRLVEGPSTRHTRRSRHGRRIIRRREQGRQARGQQRADPVPEGDLPALRLQERWSLHRVERREHPDQG